MGKAMTRARRWLITTAIVVAIATSCYAARGLILLALGTWLDVGERPEKADFVMILTGEENNRPFLAAALLRAGYAQRALVAQCRMSSNVIDGIVHYCVANMPGAVPLTSTIALTNVTLGYGLAIAEHGLEQACRLSAPISKGVNLYLGKCVYKNVADDLGLDYDPLESVFK